MKVAIMERYRAEGYWEEVGQELLQRTNRTSSIASDDTPFYVLKQRLFFERFLDPALQSALSVLEIGQGPGGNLERLQEQGKQVFGVDISPSMIQLARERGIKNAVLMTTPKIPFEDRFCDAVFTSTVLQHNRSADVESLLREMARVARHEIHLFEDTSPVPVRDRRSHWLRKPAWYASRLEDLGYELTDKHRLPLAWQEIAAIIARITLDGKRTQGAAPTPKRLGLEKQMLKIGRAIDRSIPPVMGLTHLSFRRVN